jgi:myo-inositol 2-dehydrogenase/D-chiro-inositol 1-dehydrogenase
MDKRAFFKEKPWYASKEAGRTPIVGTGIHEVDELRHLVGSDIIAVAAFGNRIGDMEFPKDKTTAAIFKFRNGAVGQVTVTYVAKPKLGRSEEGNFLLTGTQGGVVGSRFARNGSDVWEDLPPDFYSNTQEGVNGCVAGFIDTMITGKNPPVSGLDAFASLAACVAADQSSATGQIVQPEVYSR